MNLKKYLYVLAGAAVMALSLDVFLVPARIAPGGVSGLATVISYFANLPVGIMIFVINIPILIWGVFEFDIRFLVSSIVGTLALSVFTEIFALCLHPVTDNEMLSAISGGVLMGFGMAMVLRTGSTTGGTDIVAKILKKRLPYFSMGLFILIIDAAVVVLSAAVSGKWEIMLYSGISLYVSTKVIDGILDGVNYGKMALIISDYAEDISKIISKKMHRGTTNLYGFSTFSGADKRVVMCVVRRNEIVKLKELVKNADEKSFVIVADVREVLGNGFAQS